MGSSLLGTSYLPIDRQVESPQHFSLSRGTIIVALDSLTRHSFYSSLTPTND